MATVVRSEPAFASIAALLLVACDPTSAVDAGTERDAGSDASAVTLCERPADCGAEFCVTWRCDPGHERANARGCVDEGSPCGAEEVCDESSAECRACADGADADGDGHDAVECGGDDCDDADGSRFPGNPEVCDAEGQDEDCDPTTLGDVDADGDGFISAACCNGDVCGEDCDDTARALSPASAEQCNTLDDDCDGEVDDGDVCAEIPGPTDGGVTPPIPAGDGAVPPVPGTDAGVHGGGDPLASGCACRATAAPSATPWPLLLLAGAVLARRRRR